MDYDESIEALLSLPEGPQLAFAREKTRLDDLAETLVSFANAQGGTLVLGVAGRARHERREYAIWQRPAICCWRRHWLALRR